MKITQNVAQYPLHYANHAPAKFEVAMCKMHLQEIYFLVNASPKPLEIQCMSPTCMHLHFFKFEVAIETSIQTPPPPWKKLDPPLENVGPSLPLRKKMHCREQFSQTASEYSATVWLT